MRSCPLPNRGSPNPKSHFSSLWASSAAWLQPKPSHPHRIYSLQVPYPGMNPPPSSPKLYMLSAA